MQDVLLLLHGRPFTIQGMGITVYLYVMRTNTSLLSSPLIVDRGIKGLLRALYHQEIRVIGLSMKFLQTLKEKKWHIVAIREFQTPKSITGMRSWFGLVN